ncbi:hypothetical protein Anas_01497 [Armadillidium nasatum]|uniref:Uncharacterized protein n=1 Tax=Armadillidium nasatum TaxID=96803 RepID=A0A5N5TPA7_9CRUS|nr:hypothetical protein Anas_01497 [Armadillidium nasatum]
MKIYYLLWLFPKSSEYTTITKKCLLSKYPSLAKNFETEVAELFQELTRISNIKNVEDILRESNKVVEASEVSATYKYVSRHSGTVKDVIEKFEEIRDAEKKDDN